MSLVNYQKSKRNRILPGLLMAAFFILMIWYSIKLHSTDAWLEEMYKPGIRGKLVIIDPGHGGADPGAIVDGVKESEINLAIARELKRELENAGAQVLLTREEKGELVPEEKMSYSEWLNNLRKRRQFAQDKKGHMLISLHANTSSSKQASGGEVYRPRVNDKNIQLSEAIQRELNDFWSAKREAQEKGFAVINWAVMPSVLIEVGFLTNDRDRALLLSKEGRKKVAQAICRGIVGFYDELPHEEK